MDQMNIKCGSCKGRHSTVAEVKVCYATASAQTGQAILARLVEPVSPAPIYASVDRQRAAQDNLAAIRTAARLFSTPIGQTSAREPGAASAATQRTCADVDVKAGRYALVDCNGIVKFFKVDRPTEGKWKGWTFLSAQASDDFWPIRDRARKAEILSQIASDPYAALVRYGRELGVCGVCGRALTDAESRANGIGPICAAKP